MPKAKNRGPQTLSKRKYNTKNYDIITIFVRKGDKEFIKGHAANMNMSMNEYVKNALYGKLESDNVILNSSQDEEQVEE